MLSSSSAEVSSEGVVKVEKEGILSSSSAEASSEGVKVVENGKVVVSADIGDDKASKADEGRFQGDHLKADPSLIVGKFIEVKVKGRGKVISFDKISLWQQITSQHSHHTIEFDEHRTESILLSRYKKGSLNGGADWAPEK